MLTRVLSILLIILAISSCKEDEQVLPETTANGILTIEEVDYRVNYGMIKDAGPDGNGLRAYRIVLSDKPIGWNEEGNFYSTRNSGFSVMVNFLTYRDSFEQGRYEFWAPDEHPEDLWWVLESLNFKNRNSSNRNHPNQGAIVLSELDGDYSMIFHLMGDTENEQASIRGTIFGELPLIIED